MGNSTVGESDASERMFEYVQRKRREETRTGELAGTANLIRERFIDTMLYSDNCFRARFNSTVLRSEERDPVYQKIHGLVMQENFDFSVYVSHYLGCALTFIHNRNMKEEEYKFFLETSPEFIPFILDLRKDNKISSE